MKYDVTVIFDCSKSVEVEADSPEAAAEQAYEEVSSPRLCHQCSDEVALGDPIRAIVFDEMDTVLDDDENQKELATLRAQLTASEASRKELREALEEVSKCFQAAAFEGLGELLADSEDARLKDIMYRRVLPACATADAALANDAERKGGAQPDVATESFELGRWLSAALEDPNACEEFKADVRRWFDAGMPGYQTPASVLADAEPSRGAS